MDIKIFSGKLSRGAEQPFVFQLGQLRAGGRWGSRISSSQRAWWLGPRRPPHQPLPFCGDRDCGPSGNWRLLHTSYLLGPLRELPRSSLSALGISASQLWRGGSCDAESHRGTGGPLGPARAAELTPAPRRAPGCSLGPSLASSRKAARPCVVSQCWERERGGKAGNVGGPAAGSARLSLAEAWGQFL